MRLTVLGCWAPYTPADGACSGYLLQDGGANIILDLGHGAFSRIGHFVHHADIKVVVITHLHPDHYVDLHCLRHATKGALRDGLRRNRIKLFIPSEPDYIFKELQYCSDAFEVMPIENLPIEKLPSGAKVRQAEIGAVNVSFLPVRHSTMSAYALGIKGSGYLVYSGDAVPSKELTEFAEKAGIFLCEASGLDKDLDTFKEMHFTARQAGELAAQAKVKELILTHFYPEYDLEQIRSQAQEGYGRPVVLAREGDTYFLY